VSKKMGLQLSENNISVIKYRVREKEIDLDQMKCFQEINMTIRSQKRYKYRHQPESVSLHSPKKSATLSLFV